MKLYLVGWGLVIIGFLLGVLVAALCGAAANEDGEKYEYLKSRLANGRQVFHVDPNKAERRENLD